MRNGTVHITTKVLILAPAETTAQKAIPSSFHSKNGDVVGSRSQYSPTTGVSMDLG